MITIRYKKRKEHDDYSVYLDIYIPRNKTTGEEKQRKYESGQSDLNFKNDFPVFLV